jgi:hypothetical protein
VDEFLVLTVKRYDFMNNGQRVEGMQVFYLDDEVLKDTNLKGQEVVKISGPSHLFSKFTTVPGMYRLGIKTRPGAGGKATVRLFDAEYVGNVSISAKVATK